MVAVKREPVGKGEADVGFRCSWVGRSEGLRRVGLVGLIV